VSGAPWCSCTTPNPTVTRMEKPNVVASRPTVLRSARSRSLAGRAERLPGIVATGYPPLTASARP